MIDKLKLYIPLTLSLLGVTYFALQNYKHKQQLIEHRNQIVTLQGVVQETETAKSRLAVELADLRASSAELQAIIEDREQEIVTQTRVVFKPKPVEVVVEKVVEIKIEDRVRVEFTHSQPPVHVSGYTLTNPAEAHITVDWVEDLELEINLAVDKSGAWRAYVDSEDIELGDITLNIDQSVLARKWYENISFGANLAAGPSLLISGVGVGYDFGAWSADIRFGFVLTNEATFYLGANGNYFPWR